MFCSALPSEPTTREPTAERSGKEGLGDGGGAVPARDEDLRHAVFDGVHDGSSDFVRPRHDAAEERSTEQSLL